MIKKVLIALLIISAISCKNSEKQKTEITKTELEGFFEQQGEGQIIEINDSLVTSFFSSSYNCFPEWKISRDYFNTETPTIKVIDENTFTNQEGYTIFTYKKLKTKPTSCKELTEEQINSNTYNFETLWHTFNDQYAFFKERNIDWTALKKKYQSQFTDQTPPFEFYLLLEKMVLELNDEHSDFDVPEEFDKQWHLINQKKDTTDYKELTQQQVLKKYVQNVKTYNEGVLKWGLISSDLGYIQLNDMYSLSEDESDNPEDLLKSTHKIASSIVNDIRETKDCIIDLRFNSGGYDWLGLAFASHFIDKEYDVFKKRRRFKDGFSSEQTIDIKPSDNPYAGKVYILTSPYTVSAAETTTIATMNFPNFKRVGSRTNGALSDVLDKELPNGWTYWMSNEVYESMAGEVYEVSGVPPDYLIEYPRNKDELFKLMNIELKTEDRAIEKVINLTK